MTTVPRRTFLKLLAAVGAVSAGLDDVAFPSARAFAGSDAPRANTIPNEYTLWLPGEKDSLATPPSIHGIRDGYLIAHLGSDAKSLRPGDALEGWRLLAICNFNGAATAVFEKHATHRGVLAYVTEHGGTIAFIPKFVGKLSAVRPRQVNAPASVQLKRTFHYTPGPDVVANYLLDSAQDPSYENVAALGPEYTGYTLVANEETGPEKSLLLAPDGRSRQGSLNPLSQWAPDLDGALFDPVNGGFAPGANPQVFDYIPGFSKRTLLGGYLPVADTAVWNADFNAGYEAMVLLPREADPEPMARIRYQVPEDQLSESERLQRDTDGNVYIDRYWNTTPERFFAELAGIWNRWHFLYEDKMKVQIPDPWLLDAARAGITLCRCSYHGLLPTYQIGEGAYTKITGSHMLFPVAHYEFIWAQQLWNLTEESDLYFQFYLDNYILPDGNFEYNTMAQVEAPLNTGVLLANSARAYFYTRSLAALQKRLPILRRMIGYVLKRYEYSKTHFPPTDRRYGLIWGSPEADLGDPSNDFPESHPYYYQNAAHIWRGLTQHAKCLLAASEQDPTLRVEADSLEAIAAEMRANIQRSLDATIAAENPAMRSAAITPFTPSDTTRDPKILSDYENHRFMEDWFLADWGVPALDEGHLIHRALSGDHIFGLSTDGNEPRTSNFMAHGTLSVLIRQDDYRPFLVALYGLACFAADSGNRYSPEDAYIPGGTPGDGNKYFWSAVVNSVLQPTIGLRWLLCYDENDQELCHFQKAAPRHWFHSGETISVENCPTRFGLISWSTVALSDQSWKVSVSTPKGFTGDISLHIHPDHGATLRSTSAGTIQGNSILLHRTLFQTATNLQFVVS